MAAFPDGDPQGEKWTDDLALKIEAGIILLLQVYVLLALFFQA
jgi:hypothetical protein